MPEPRPSPKLPFHRIGAFKPTAAGATALDARREETAVHVRIEVGADAPVAALDEAVRTQTEAALRRGVRVFEHGVYDDVVAVALPFGVEFAAAGDQP